MGVNVGLRLKMIAASVSGTAVTTAPVTPDLNAVTAVLAHNLLNSLSIVRGGAELLSRRADDLPEGERRAWYERIDDHTAYLGAVLERLAQGRLDEALSITRDDFEPRHQRIS